MLSTVVGKLFPWTFMARVLVALVYKTTRGCNLHTETLEDTVPPQMVQPLWDEHVHTIPVSLLWRGHCQSKEK